MVYFYRKIIAMGNEGTNLICKFKNIFLLEIAMISKFISLYSMRLLEKWTLKWIWICFDYSRFLWIYLVCVYCCGQSLRILYNILKPFKCISNRFCILQTNAEIQFNIYVSDFMHHGKDFKRAFAFWTYCKIYQRTRKFYACI